MMPVRALALLSMVVLVTIPTLGHLNSGSVAVAALAGALCVAGVLGRVSALVTAGASLTLVQYTLTLVITDAPASVLGAVGFGVTLALVVDVSEFCRRFHGATVSPSAWRGQARHWLVSVAVGAGLASSVGAVAVLIRIGAPPGLYPLLAAAGALVTVAGVAGAVWRRAS